MYCDDDVVAAAMDADQSGGGRVVGSGGSASDMDASRPADQHVPRRQLSPAARALAELEVQLAGLSATPDGCATLFALLEAECAAVGCAAAEQAAAAGAAAAENAAVCGGGPSPQATPDKAGGGGGFCRGRRGPPGMGAMLDPGPVRDASLVGAQRIHYTGDSEQAALEAEKFLRPGRHGEWTESSLDVTNTNQAWGVALVPPGIDVATATPAMMDVVRKQNLR